MLKSSCQSAHCIQNCLDGCMFANKLLLMTNLRRWHRLDGRARMSFCGRCNKNLRHTSSDTCLLEGWQAKDRKPWINDIVALIAKTQQFWSKQWGKNPLIWSLCAVWTLEESFWGARCVDESQGVEVSSLKSQQGQGCELTALSWETAVLCYWAFPRNDLVHSSSLAPYTALMLD